jgi:hypothetical protein
VEDARELRKLAEWYRGFAEVGHTEHRQGRLGSRNILNAKLTCWRSAQRRARPRGEARRLTETVKNLSDPQLRKELAVRSLALANRA